MKVRRNGPFFIPKYTGEGFDCWDNGCNFKMAEEACRDNLGQYGQLATINSTLENYQIGQLLRKFGSFAPWKEDLKTYYWFYNALKEEKIKGRESIYTWKTSSWRSDGMKTNFTNW